MSAAETHHETLIYVLVEATDHRTAISRAKPVLDDVVTATNRAVESFRDYAMFHGDELERLTAVWGEKPSAASLESDEGQALLEEGWNRTKNIFEDNLTAVEEIMEMYTTQEIMENVENVRLHFLRLGATVGPSVPLYTETGYPIRDRRELDQFLDSHGEVWVVPAVGVS